MKRCSKSKIILILLLGVALITYSCSCLEVRAFPDADDFWRRFHEWYNSRRNRKNQQDDSGNQENPEDPGQEELTEEEKAYKKVLDALECASKGNARDLMELYNLKLDLDTDGIFTLSMNPDEKKFRDYPELKYINPTFTVSRILIASPTTRVIGFEEYLENNSLLKILDDIYTSDRLNNEFGIWNQVLSKTSSISFRNVRSDVVVYYIVLESTEFDPILSSECGIDDARSYFAIPVYAYGAPEEIKTIHIDYGDGNATPTKSLVDCYANNPAGSFEANYCADLLAACGTYDVSKCKNKNFIKFTADGEKIPTYANYIKKNSKKTIGTFKCDPFMTAAADGSYYTEKQYIVGTITQRVKLKNEETGEALQYVYNYGGQYPEGYKDKGWTGMAPYKNESDLTKGQYVKPVKQDIYCNVDCTEVVTVEYGPPVATAAGLCFEYKVKTTSRINCTSKLETLPKEDQTYCKPTASCVTPKPPSPPITDYYYYDPEGPNEDFDMCILACDEGKYTDKCTRYCYNEVYGTSTNILKNKVADFSEVVEKLRNQNPMANNCDYSKNFFYSIGSTIKWRQVDCVATPYLSEDGKYHGEYTWVKNYANGGGIPCAMSCVLECKWTKCGSGGKNVYLNEGEAERDAKKNKVIYEKAKTACDSFIKCNTTAAEFSIDVTYNYPESKNGTNIHFPYSNNDPKTADTIQYTKDNVSCSKAKANSTINFGDGCYLCNRDKLGEVSYQTEWGLPPTWINKKNGTISYSDEYQGNDSWIKKNKFCLPLDATSTNAEWWNAYYEARAKENGVEFSYEDQEYMNGIDETKCTATNCESAASSTTVKDYNISAHAKNFGMFSWNIDIACFYATNTDTARFADNKTCKSDNCSTGYTIRSVDLNQMFPSSSDENIERSAGFNWSTYASVTKEKLETPGITQEKNEKYTSYPSLYKQWVESENYNVYSEDYLDYYVKLTKDSINAIKKAGVTNYANFEGQSEVLSSSSVVNYLSPLLRGQARSDFKINDLSYPSLSVLRCNNIGKHLGGKEGYMADCLDYEELDVKESGTNE